jgi:hypothetical protein
MAPVFHTLGKLALKLHVQDHQLTRLCDRGKVPFQRAGRIRLFAESDIPAIRAALIAAGYLKPESREVIHA